MILHRKSRLSKNQWDLTVSKSSFFLLDLDLILKINDRSLSVNPIEEEMIVHCKERLWKNQFDLTVRKDERFLLDLSLLLLSLFHSVSQFHCLTRSLRYLLPEFWISSPFSSTKDSLEFTEQAGPGFLACFHSFPCLPVHLLSLWRTIY